MKNYRKLLTTPANTSSDDLSQRLPTPVFQQATRTIRLMGNLERPVRETCRTLGKPQTAKQKAKPNYNRHWHPSCIPAFAFTAAY